MVKKTINITSYEVVDESENLLAYKDDRPIIYVADYYFKSIKVSDGGRRKKTQEHCLKEQLYCDNGQVDWWIKQFKNKLGIKDDVDFSCIKIVLKKAFSYSNVIKNKSIKTKNHGRSKKENKKG